MSQLAKEHRDEQIAKVELPKVDCACMDRRTRKVLSYILAKEIKYLRGFPKAWVEGQLYDLTALKEQIDNCALEKGRAAHGGRGQSPYQAFMKECVSSKEKGGRGLPFIKCVSLWRAERAAE